MIVDVHIPSAAQAPQRHADRRESGPDEAASEDAFAGLLAAVQGGFGQRTETSAGLLHHESAPLATDATDSHQQRLAQMKEEASAEAGPSSRLQAGRGGATDMAGPRGQRLSLEKQELAEQRPEPEVAGSTGTKSRAAAAAAEPGAGPRLREGGLTQSGSRTDPAAMQPPIATKPPGIADRVAPPATPEVQTASSGRTVSPVASPIQEATVPPATPSQAAAGATGVDTIRGNGSHASVAEQIGRAVAARSGVETARAVTGTEQAGATRGTPAAGQPAAESPSALRMAASKSQPGTGNASGASESEGAGKSNFDRLVRSIRLNVGAGRSTASMRLDPPELGWIRIETRVEADRVQLFIQTETTSAGELLRGRVGDLQMALEQHGLKIDRFELGPAPTEERHGAASGQPEASEHDARQPAPGNDTDRGLGGGERQESGTPAMEPSPSEEERIEAPDRAAVDSRLDVRV